MAQPKHATYISGEELLNSDGRVDIAFLDVEMPGITGITVGKILKEKYPYAKIFILTSYSDYLDEAMRFHVFRYLSKPVDKKRLFRNMKDALYQLSIDTREVSIETKEQTVMISSRLMTSQSSLLPLKTDTSTRTPRTISNGGLSLPCYSSVLTDRRHNGR